MTIFIILSEACFDDDRQFSPKASDDEDKTAHIRRPRASGRKKRGGRGHFSRTQTQSLFPVRRSLEIISRLAPICARSHPPDKSEIIRTGFRAREKSWVSRLFSKASLCSRRDVQRRVLQRHLWREWSSRGGKLCLYWIMHKNESLLVRFWKWINEKVIWLSSLDCISVFLYKCSIFF